MDSLERLEVRLRAGGELSPGEAARLLGVGRTSVHRMLESGDIRYTRTSGGHRRCHPEDLLRTLEDRRRLHTGRIERAPETSA